MIPKPVAQTIYTESFPAPRQFSAGDGLTTVAEELNHFLNGLQSQTTPDESGKAWRLELHTGAAYEHPETYQLEIDQGRILLSAADPQALRYALSTLKQLLFSAHKTDSLIHKQLIRDYPRYRWRGLHLDVSRHIFEPAFIKQYLKLMSELKLNKFHWHLTDDQGWRIESKRYPLLQEIGAWRKEADGERYGGYYTQGEIREVVAYATELGIEVIPELDLPGHMTAVLSAYPQLACNPQAFDTMNVWGISEDILCAGKDSTRDFILDLVDEVAELFPGAYFHLGGDEAPKDRWKACPYCQKRIRELGLKDEEDLQSWLFDTVSAHLALRGKTVIGWDEILEGNPSRETIAMLWRGDAKAAALQSENRGYRAILVPNHYLYFDWKASDDSPGAFGVTTLQKVWQFPIDEYFTQRPDLLLGVQANLWTEQISTPQRAWEMLIPRVYALSELAWGKQSDYPDFEARAQLGEDYISYALPR